MELKDFVRDTLAQIIEGVCAAQRVAGEKGATIVPNAPDGIQGSTSRPGGPVILLTGEILTSVAFDVALTSASATETKGAIGVFLGTVGLGSQGKSTEEASSLSRIKFEVPLVLPIQPESRGKTWSE